MNKQVDVDIKKRHEGIFLARWFICDNGITVAEGEAEYECESRSIDWLGSPPAPEYYVDVAFEIDRAVLRRQRRTQNQPNL